MIMQAPEAPKPALDAKEQAPPPWARRARAPASLAGVALLAVLGFAWALQNYGRDDRQAVLDQVREMKAGIRSHGPGLWMFVEGNDAPEPPDPKREARHQAILRDFERLAHLDGFDMTDIIVEVRGAEALVSYRVSGVATPIEPPPPAGGEIRFRRGPAGWVLEDHRFVESR